MFENIDDLRESLEKLLGEHMQLLRNYPINNRSCNKKEPFNLILASSDLYYRENFHSDIISYILKHKKYATLFIKYLSSLKKEIEIKIENYDNPEVTREENRVDILIKDEATKHCIIVENKINNACDMNRQLPRYYETLKKNYNVDAIVYLSIDGNKRPSRLTWTDEELNLDGIIIYCAISDNNETEKDFINGFLEKCILEANEDIRECAFFSQYIDLLLYLGRNQMDYTFMEQFHRLMIEPKNYKAALDLRAMLDNLIEHRRKRIEKTYRNNNASNPFVDFYPITTNYRGDAKDGFGFIKIPDLLDEIKIDCLLYSEKTVIIFWIQNLEKSKLIKTVLATISLDDFLIEEHGGYIKCFKKFDFPEDECSFDKYLDKLFGLLIKNKERIKEQISKAR